MSGIQMMTSYGFIRLTPGLSCTVWIQILEKTSAIRGPDSRFVLKAIIKALISKSSRSSIMKTLNRVHPIHNNQPDLS